MLPRMSSALSSNVVVVACALLTTFGMDTVLGKVASPPPADYDTADGIKDYAASDPDVLVLGSSYARSFVAISEALAKEVPAQHMAVMPIEGGKFVAYEWLLS